MKTRIFLSIIIFCLTSYLVLDRSIVIASNLNTSPMTIAICILSGIITTCTYLIISHLPKNTNDHKKS